MMYKYIFKKFRDDDVCKFGQKLVRMMHAIQVNKDKYSSPLKLYTGHLFLVLGDLMKPGGIP